jgi:hypothetical protein
MRLPEWKYASDAQLVYLKRLFNECFVKGVSLGFDTGKVFTRRMLKIEASELIDSTLKALKTK